MRVLESKIPATKKPPKADGRNSAASGVRFNCMLNDATTNADVAGVTPRHTRLMMPTTRLIMEMGWERIILVSIQRVLQTHRIRRNDRLSIPT